MTGAAVSAERLAAAARAQTGLADARVSDVRPAWDDRLPGLWGVTVKGPGRRANAFLRVADDRVAVPAGMSQAARELSELAPLDGDPWGGGLIYIVTAAGGATPGFPDSWRADEAPLPDGGVRLTVHMPEAWVAYAAAGGVGPPPADASGRSGGGGVTPPAAMATATLDVAADYSLQWRYQLAGRETDGPSGTPADAPPALSDEELVAALDGARLRAAAPRAMPVREPRPLPSRPDVLVVDLWALGPVYVPADGAGANVDWAVAPEELVPLLCAAGLLPPGLLPQDLSAARVADGELTATLPAPLVEWAAGGARQRSPRVAGVKSDAEMAGEGRVRVPLDGSSEWTLEVADGGGWRPARGDTP